METRETKDTIDTIKNKARNMSVNIATMKKSVEEMREQLSGVNKKLDRIVALMEEEERRRLVQK